MAASSISPSELLRFCPPPHPRFASEPATAPVASSSSGSSFSEGPTIEVVNYEIPQIIFNQQFWNLSPHYQGPVYQLLENQIDGGKIIIERESINRKLLAQKIKHNRSELTRSLFITQSNRLFMLFTRCSREGDFLVGKGSFKKHAQALDLKTFEFYDIVSAKRVNDCSEGNFREFQILSKVMKSVVPDSFMQGKYRDYWIEKLDKGDLLMAVDDCPEYFKSKKNRLDLAMQMARELVHMHNCGFYHLDVKLENYLYSPNEHGMLSVRLTDCGFSIRKDEPLWGLCGSLMYMAPEAFREGHAYQTTCSEKPYTFASEQYEGWSLGIAYFFAFYPYLNPEILKNNFVLEEIMNLAGCEPEIQTEALNKLWATRSLPLTQEEWIKQPSNSQSIEYLIWKLLQIDPAMRWTPREALSYLTTLMN